MESTSSKVARHISKNVMVIKGNCNSYVIEGSILIDTPMKESYGDYSKILSECLKPKAISDIKKVILTHFHYDHIGCLGLFNGEDVRFLASYVPKPDEILQYALRKDAADFIDKIIKQSQLKNIFKDPELSKIFKIIPTPGHCKSSIILYYPKDNVLFTGDTFFYEGCIGRTDLPTSIPERMDQSIKVVRKIIEEHDPIICPGHGY